jgi:hypothetical protein
MQYREALQRKDGKWDYAVTWDKVTRPTGYCATKCSGHETKEEAEECYRIYMIDNASYRNVPFDEDRRDQHHKCEICGIWTMCRAQVDPIEEHFLCPEHLNKESLLKVVPAPGCSASSW